MGSNPGSAIINHRTLYRLLSTSLRLNFPIYKVGHVTSPHLVGSDRRFNEI